jgi:hypothetical protein
MEGSHRAGVRTIADNAATPGLGRSTSRAGVRSPTGGPGPRMRFIPGRAPRHAGRRRPVRTLGRRAALRMAPAGRGQHEGNDGGHGRRRRRHAETRAGWKPHGDRPRLPPTTRGARAAASVARSRERELAPRRAGTLRAIVFGASDGFVSNLARDGIAGATAENSIILLSGIAGLFAGAFSMAAGVHLGSLARRWSRRPERAGLAAIPDEEFEEPRRDLPSRDSRGGRATVRGAHLQDQVVSDARPGGLGWTGRDHLAVVGPWARSRLHRGGDHPVIPFLFGAANSSWLISSG